jgi:hypothetical protein
MISGHRQIITEEIHHFDRFCPLLNNRFRAAYIIDCVKSHIRKRDGASMMEVPSPFDVYVCVGLG